MLETSLPSKKRPLVSWSHVEYNGDRNERILRGFPMGRRYIAAFLLGALALSIGARLFYHSGPGCPALLFHLLIVNCPSSATWVGANWVQPLAGVMVLCATAFAAWRLFGQRQWGWLLVVVLIPILGVASYALVGPELT